MGFFYYFLGSVVLGIIPAIIARQAKRNFFLWWLYGALLFPAAILHSILLVLKTEKGMYVVYTLIIVYGLGIFYFGTWFLSTQPVSIQQGEVCEARYKIAELILKDRDIISGGQVTDLKNYVAQQTKLKQPAIEKALEDFDNQIITDKPKLTQFALDLLLSLDKIFKYISDKGAFDEFSVPMGAAAQVFTYYIDSLNLLNKYEEKDVSVVEANYESMLSTEQMYFKTTKNSRPFLEHLDAEARKDNSRDRMLTIIDHFLSVGKILTMNGQKDEAMRCDDAAISLYNKILKDSALVEKDRAGFMYKIAEANDKKGDAIKILVTFNDYLDLLFRASLYTDKDTSDDIQKFVKLDTIMKKHENLARTIQNFMALAEKNKSADQKDIANMTNSVLTAPEIFSKLTETERNNYVKEINANYKIIVQPDDINSLPTIQKAFTFFEDYRYSDLADYYMAAAKKLYEKLQTTEDGVVADYNKLADYVAAAKERVLALMDLAALKPKEKTEVMDMKTKIDAEMKRLETLNTNIKSGRNVIAAMVDPKASEDETFKVESGTRDSVREFQDIYAAIADKLK
jgi:hypothetical protein